jgi:SAM-dependent methyltransferase
MSTDLAAYWEARARRFGHVDRGLPAVCAYGMPKPYNEAIHACQRRALTPWLNLCRDADVLDIGCGVGRWSLELARRGNRVVGVDISEAMLERARDAAVGRPECRFLRQDVTELALGRKFDCVLGVTVLQHVVGRASLERAARNLVSHLSKTGRVVLLEVAPSRATKRCDSDIFRVRTTTLYVDLLQAAGLEVTHIEGVEIAPLRPLVMPAVRRLPTSIGRGLLTASTLASLPLDLWLSRYLPDLCWHKIFVARHA